LVLSGITAFPLQTELGWFVSAIIAPDGRYLAGPVFEDEVVLTATLDLLEIEKESMTLDVSGHYSRPDIFELHVAVPLKRP
jgi:nitrilase